MIKIKIVSSLEKIFIDGAFDSYKEIKSISVLRGERLNFQIVTTYDTSDGTMPYIAPKFMPTVSGGLEKYATLRYKNT